MGYDLYIGEAKIEDYGDGSELVIRVDAMEHTEAPRFENDFSFADGANHRHPSYTGWHDFTRFVNLEQMFYDDEKGLLRPHPGAKRLTDEHLKRVRFELHALKQKYPNAKPRFGSPPKLSDDPNESEPEEVPIEDAQLARLIWLEWWIAYALENCEMPTFYNR